MDTLATNAFQTGVGKYLSMRVCQRRDEDRHHVAGLHGYHAVMPPTPSDWPALPGSNLETDQSTHHEYVLATHCHRRNQTLLLGVREATT